MVQLGDARDAHDDQDLQQKRHLSMVLAAGTVMMPQLFGVLQESVGW